MAAAIDPVVSEGSVEELSKSAFRLASLLVSDHAKGRKEADRIRPRSPCFVSCPPPEGDPTQTHVRRFYQCRPSANGCCEPSRGPRARHRTEGDLSRGDRV